VAARTAREETPSLPRTLATWQWTVCSHSTRLSAIGWLLMPLATSRETSSSRRVSPAGAAPSRDAVGFSRTY
jgi:hypothetical protein